MAPEVNEKAAAMRRKSLSRGLLVVTAIGVCVGLWTGSVEKGLVWAGIAALPYVWLQAALWPATREWAYLPWMLVKAPRAMAAIRYYEDVKIERVESLPEDWSAEERSEVEKLAADIAREGFVPRGIYTINGLQSPGCGPMYVLPLVHEHRRHLGWVSFIPSVPRTAVGRPAVDFNTHIGDRRVIVNNSPAPTMFGLRNRSREIAVLAFLRTQSVPELYRVFQGFVESERGTGLCRLRTESLEEQFRDNIVYVLRAWERHGYMRRVGEGELKLTTWGSLRGGWGSIPVISKLRHRREQAHFERVRRKLRV